MVTGNLSSTQSCGGVSNVHLTCLDGSQSSIFGHKHHGHILDGRFAAVVVFIGSEHDLLLGTPLHKLVGAGTNGIGTVIFTVCMFGDNANGSQGVQENRSWLGQGHHQSGIVLGNCAFHVGQVNTTLCSLGSFQSKGNVSCGDLLAIGKVSIVTDGEGPDKSVFRQLIGSSQIIFESQVSLVLDQSALDNGRITVAPAFGGIQRIRFAANGNDHAVLHLSGNGFRGLCSCLGCFRCFCRFLCAAGSKGESHDQSHQ